MRARARPAVASQIEAANVDNYATMPIWFPPTAVGVKN